MRRPLFGAVAVMKSFASNLQGLSTAFLGSGLRYALVGVLNTALSYAVFYVGVHRGIGHLLALAVSYAVGVVHSFLWNRYWTFKAEGAFRRQVPKFLAVTLVTFALNAVMLQALVHAGLPAAMAQLFCLVVTTAVGYLGHRLWSFR